MRLNLYVACCSALVYFSNAIQLQPEGVAAADEMATDFAEIYQNEYVTDLAETSMLQEEQDAPTKPREAFDLEKDIKENEVKLRLMKARPFEIIQAEDAARAKKLNREPKGTNELNAQEEQRVEQQKDMLRKVIRKDQGRLEEIFPESARVALIEHKKQESEKALGIIRSMGDQLGKADGEALAKIVKDAQAIQTEKED